MFGKKIGVALAVLGALGSQGCAVAALPLFGLGQAVNGGTEVVSYTSNSVAYKTFAASETEVRAATLQTFKRMAIDVTGTEWKEKVTEIDAAAGDRTVEVEIDRITPRTSQMRVVVKKGWFLRDRATAGEIVTQTGDTLGSKPATATTAGGRRRTS
jgi:hypothetical protein